MSLICCPLQCGKFISSFLSHKNECPNKNKLGKFCEQCPYNPEHVLSIKALKVHTYFCPNKPKNSIFKLKHRINETLSLKKEIPPYDIVRSKRNENQHSKKNMPISLSEGSLSETFKVYKRNNTLINENINRIKNQERKLLSYYIDNKVIEKEMNSNENDINYNYSIENKVIDINKNNNIFEKTNYNIIKKESTEEKSILSTTSEETINLKKNFQW